jgi:hypothetical protein
VLDLLQQLAVANVGTWRSGCAGRQRTPLAAMCTQHVESQAGDVV